MRHVFGDGITGTVGEKAWIIGDSNAWLGSRPPALILHGAGDTATSMWQNWAYAPQIASAGFLTVLPDAGGPTNWGGPTSITRSVQALDYLASAGAGGPAVIVAGSMGAVGALNLARLHPSRVAAVALIAPALDLSVWQADSTLLSAYGGSYDSAYNPLEFTDSLGDIPIHIWAGTADVTTPMEIHTNPFIEGRPSTELTTVEGADHSSIHGLILDQLIDWVNNFV